MIEECGGEGPGRGALSRSLFRKAFLESVTWFLL